MVVQLYKMISCNQGQILNLFVWQYKADDIIGFYYAYPSISAVNTGVFIVTEDVKAAGFHMIDPFYDDRIESPAVNCNHIPGKIVFPVFINDNNLTAFIGGIHGIPVYIEELIVIF